MRSTAGPFSAVDALFLLTLATGSPLAGAPLRLAGFHREELSHNLAQAQARAWAQAQAHNYLGITITAPRRTRGASASPFPPAT